MELSKEYLALQKAAKMEVKHNAAVEASSKRIVKIDGEFVHGKRVKHVLIEATFPELKGGAMYQCAHGEASGTKPAIARAFRNLLKTIPGKRVAVIRATISITTKMVEG
jgi:hypothetical protein